MPDVSQPQVRIQNPKGNNPYTSIESAQRHIDRDLARWCVDGIITARYYKPDLNDMRIQRLTLLFTNDPHDYRAASIAASDCDLQDGYDRDVNRGVRATLKAVKGLPVVGNVVKVFSKIDGPRMLHRSGVKLAPGRVIVQAGQPVA